MSVDTRCRLCGVTCQAYLNIFEEEGLNQEINVKISCCLQIMILKKDILPKTICHACYSNLNLSYDFFTKSHMAQLSLHKSYESIINTKQSSIEHSNNETKNLNTISMESIVYNNMEQLINNNKSNINENDKEHELAKNFHLPVLQSNSEKQNYDKSVLQVKKLEQLLNKIESHTQETDTIIFSNIEKNTRENKLQIRKNKKIHNIATTKLSTSITPVDNFCFAEIFQEYQWTCTICQNFNVNSFSALYQHYKIAHNQEPPLKCNICDKVYEIYASFRRHLSEHRDYKRYKCDVCDKTFSRKAILLNHMAVHSDERPYVCSSCGKSFKTPSSIHAHKKLHFPDDTRETFVCEFCSKKLANKAALMRHRIIHTGKYDYMCDICGKSFAAKSCLINHIATAHVEDRKFTCKECTKSFKTNKSLKTHMTLHAARQYRCDVCSKQFHRYGYLKDHMRIHTGDLPFKCEYCEKAFRLSGNLISHRRQHTGEKPYQCADCLRCFTNFSNYNKHIKNVHHVNANDLENNQHKKRTNIIETKLTT